MPVGAAMAARSIASSCASETDWSVKERTLVRAAMDSSVGLVIISVFMVTSCLTEMAVNASPA